MADFDIIKRTRRSWIKPGSKGGLGWIFFSLILAATLRAGEPVVEKQDHAKVRFSISSGMFRDVNENDARASVKAYAQQIADSRGFTADPNPIIFTEVTELTTLLKAEAVDIVSLPASEFLALDKNLTSTPILISILNGLDFEEYVLVVGKDSGFNTPADLKNRRLSILNNLQGALVECWLDVLLAENSLAPPANFFDHITRHYKASQALLPVYFQQADACIVTRQGFNLMAELNPQISKKLRILAASPQVVPHVTFFRVGLDKTLKEKILRTMTETHTTPSGKQLMTIFQCERIVQEPISRLRSTQELLETHARLCARKEPPAEPDKNPPTGPLEKATEP